MTQEADEFEAQDHRFTVDENGTARCGLLVSIPDSIDTVEVMRCGADLYVDWSFSVPIGPGQTSKSREVHMDAVSSQWQVACTNGHVHHVSGNAYTATDNAEPCRFDALFAATLLGSSKADL